MYSLNRKSANDVRFIANTPDTADCLRQLAEAVRYLTLSVGVDPSFLPRSGYVDATPATIRRRSALRPDVIDSWQPPTLTGWAARDDDGPEYNRWLFRPLFHYLLPTGMSACRRIRASYVNLPFDARSGGEKCRRCLERMPAEARSR